MSNPSEKGPDLDPEFRARLLKESQRPFLGVRRILWIALFGSAVIGLFVMTLRELSGEDVAFSDLGIQLGALMIFGCLLWFDRQGDS